MDYYDPSGYACDGKKELFKIDDWNGYPDNIPNPKGPFKILHGKEYSEARKAANRENSKIHRNNPMLKGKQIHEIHPVKFGGNPVNHENKIALDPKEHSKLTSWWRKIQKEHENEK